jgi:heat shock protein HslJ
MKLFKITIGIISLLFIASCEKDNVTQENCLEITQNDEPDKDLENKWVLLGYSDGTNHCVPSSITKIYISFTDSISLSGFSSCNQFQGNYVAHNNDILEINDLSSTEVYCTDDLRNTWEELFITVLTTASNFTIDGKILTIESTNGKNLVFVSN